MKKYPKYQIRVREEMLEWLRAKGPEAVKGFWEEMMRREGDVESSGLSGSAATPAVAVAAAPSEELVKSQEGRLSRAKAAVDVRVASQGPPLKKYEQMQPKVDDVDQVPPGW